jgi:hypothetical protein
MCLSANLMTRDYTEDTLMYQVWSKSIEECSQGCDGRTEGRAVALLYPLWILTKLGTYLVLRRIWNPFDFPGHRSKSPGQIFTA